MYNKTPEEKARERMQQYLYDKHLGRMKFWRCFNLIGFAIIVGIILYFLLR